MIALDTQQALLLRAEYQRLLEAELEKWVQKTQAAFAAGFIQGTTGKYRTWQEALNDWSFSEKREKKAA